MANVRPPASGCFIVLDGPEGCGKSTQTELLRQRIIAAGVSAADVLAVRDPGTTPIGEKIRQILLDPAHQEMGMRCEMLLYMAARSQMMAQTIGPALDAGKIVLSDRFVSSTLAYQLGGDGLTGEEIRRVAGIATRGRWPDLTLLLDMPASDSMERVVPKYRGASGTAAGPQMDRIEQRPMSYHEAVRRNYLAQAVDDPARYRVIDASRARDAVHQEIWHASRELLEAAN